MITLIYFIIILGIIVLVHEFGHFIFAKMTGVYVYEFSIGMGPKIIGTKPKKGKTSYSLRAIPIGGFVQLAGEEIDDDTEVPKEQKMYSKKVWQRFLIMFFGAGNNFILAILLLFIYGLAYGAPDMKPVITGVMEGYPSEEVGLSRGDKVLKLNEHNISNIDDLQIYLTLENDGSEMTFIVEKENGKEETYKVTPKKEKTDDGESYIIGIEMETKTERGIIPSIKYCFTKLGALFKQMVITFKALFTGKLSVSNLSGPVGIYSIVGKSRTSGFASLIQLTVLLCVNVGFINLLPFPAFDGGRILFLFIEKIKGSPVNPKVENIIHSIGFILLILLLLFITFNDVLRLF